MSPQTSATAVFHDHTATGKLKALITPTTPIGCHVSIRRWPGRSDGMVRPPTCRESPTAKSQMSIISWTSPRASLVILPASMVTSSARSALCSVSSSPRRLTTWPRTGAGTERHVVKASAASPTAVAASGAPSRRSSSSVCPDRGDTTGRPVPAGTVAPSRSRAASAVSRSSVVSGLSVVVLVIALLPLCGGWW